MKLIDSLKNPLIRLPAIEIVFIDELNLLNSFKEAEGQV